MKADKNILFVLILSTGMLLPAACRLSRDMGNVLDSRAVAIWRKYEIDFERGINGDQGNNEFDKACLFFEQTTGLTMHVNGSTVGVLPTPESRQDLTKIKAWFNDNKDRLYWDRSTKTVKVRPSR